MKVLKENYSFWSKKRWETYALTEWERSRGKGKNRFIRQHAFRFAVTMLTLSLAIKWILGHQIFSLEPEGIALTITKVIGYLAIGFIVWYGCGWVTATLQWRQGERAYQKWLERESGGAREKG